MKCKQPTWCKISCKLWSALHWLLWTASCFVRRLVVWAFPVGDLAQLRLQTIFCQKYSQRILRHFGLQLSRCWMESGGSSCFSFGSNMEMLSASRFDRENHGKARLRTHREEYQGMSAESRFVNFCCRT